MLFNEQPLVSIIIPCYNHANFVQDCIQSVIAQTYQNIELIIIDDGSKDETVEKIQKLVTQCTERFVKFEFRHRPNKGLSATLNEALEWCQGEYFSAIASDDMMLNDKIEIQIDFLKNSIDSTIVGVFGGYN
ncbi:TPA: glycosyltransferase family 2 protein, partial [Acinetobacter baumannii]|nr:glycosyltransferase family 2 protein [Acinetobacter baumannii]